MAEVPLRRGSRSVSCHIVKWSISFLWLRGGDCSVVIRALT